MNVRTAAGLGIRSATALASLALLAACAADPTAAGPAPGDAPSLDRESAPGASPEFRPGEVLVKFRAGASATGRARALQVASANGQERILTAAMRAAGDGEGVTLVRTGLGVGDAIARLKADPDVEYAEPNWVYTTDATWNDPLTTGTQLWGMTGTYGSQASLAWTNNRTDCGSVYVGIIDEGYYYDHDDLRANAGKNPGEVAGNGVDDDGNGLVDDVYGWDFDADDASVFDGTGDDHGTHVAGTIGASGNNGVGVAGVCWSVKLISAKFLGRRGGSTADAIAAVDYLTDLKTRHKINLVASNNSWGGGGYSKALEDAIGRANAANILFIAAAGNSSLNCATSSCYPAAYTAANVVSVASITSTGALSSFSNYGTNIHIGAPGSAILSTVPVSSKGKITSGYASYSGTSMATPHVTGAAALYAAYHAGSSAATIKAALLNGTATPSLAGKTSTGKRLSVAGF